MRWVLTPALLATFSAQAELPAAFAGIPNLTIDYYDLEGSDAAAIRAAMERQRPTDPNDGEKVDALSNPRWAWSWPGGRNGCDLAKASIEFSATVRLPRLADPAKVSAAVRGGWQRYVDALARHEAWHLRNGYAGRLEILAAIKAATCDSANDAAKAAIDRVNARDVDYDRRTRHGALDGAAF